MVVIDKNPEESQIGSLGVNVQSAVRRRDATRNGAGTHPQMATFLASIILIIAAGAEQFRAGDGLIETGHFGRRFGTTRRARLPTHESEFGQFGSERSSSFMALPDNDVSVTAANSTITLQKLPLAENQDIHHLLKNFTLEYFASIKRAEEAAKTTPAPPASATGSNCSFSGSESEMGLGYRKKVVPINLQFWSRDFEKGDERSRHNSELRLKLVHQEWIHGAIYLPMPQPGTKPGQNPPSPSPLRAAPTSFLSESTQASVSKIVEKVLQLQQQVPLSPNETNTNYSTGYLKQDLQIPQFPLSLREAHAMWRDHNSYFLLVELNFFQVRLRGRGSVVLDKNAITNGTLTFIPDTQTANMLRKPNCNANPDGASMPTPTPAPGTIYPKEDADSGHPLEPPDSPHPRIFKLIKKIKKKIKKKKKKGKKKKKKDKEHSSEEHHGPEFGYHAPPPVQQHFPQHQHQPQSSGWGQYGHGGAEIGGHEVAGWLGEAPGSGDAGSGSGWDKGQGYYELEFLPGEILQKIATTLGMVAIVIGPVIMVAAICWLVINALTGHGYKANAAPAYIFNGRGRGSTDYPSIGLLSFDDKEKYYHTLEKIAR